MQNYTDNIEYQKFLKENVYPIVEGQCVYIIEANNVYKVGITSNLERRIKQLQTGCSDVISLIAAIEIDISACNDIEKKIHRELSQSHLIGEWFDCGPEEMLRIIENYDFIQFAILESNGKKLLKY